MPRQWVGMIVGAVVIGRTGVPLQAQAGQTGGWTWAGRIGTGQTVTIDAVRADVRVLPAPSGGWSSAW